MRYHLKPIRMATIKTKQKINVGKDMEKLEPIAAGNVKWNGCSGKIVWWFLQKLKTALPHDPAISLPDVYPKEPKQASKRLPAPPLVTRAETWTHTKVHYQMSGGITCNIPIQLNITQILKKEEHCDTLSRPNGPHNHAK